MKVVSIQAAAAKKGAGKSEEAEPNLLDRIEREMDAKASIPRAFIYSPDLSGIRRISGAQDCANDSGDDEITFNAEGRKLLTAYKEHFCFDRLPRTMSELGGLLHYGQELFYCSLRSLRQPGWFECKEPYDTMLATFLDSYPDYEHALRLYTADRFDELLQHHIETNRLAALAKHYREFVENSEQDVLQET